MTSSDASIVEREPVIVDVTVTTDAVELRRNAERLTDMRGDAPHVVPYEREADAWAAYQASREALEQRLRDLGCVGESLHELADSAATYLEQLSELEAAGRLVIAP